MKKKREKDPASFQLSACFAGDELLAYLTGGLPAARRAKIFHHLNVEQCKRCRDLFLLLGQGGTGVESSHISAKVIERLKKADSITRQYPAPLKIQRGQIWTTAPRPKNARGKPLASPDGAFPVLIVSGGNGEKSLGNVIRVIPVSFDTGYELDGETVVIEEGNPLMYRALLEIFNERPMLAGNLDEYRGSVSSHDLGKIMQTRARFLDGETAKPDEEYLAWKEKEIELAEFLSFPVNDALWEEKRPGQDIEIPVSPFKKAADMAEAELSQVTPHVLLKTAGASIGIVQIRDRFLLRIVEDEPGEKPLPRILVNSRAVSLEERGPGVYETLLGRADHMTGTMELEVEIDGDHRVFHLYFRRKGESA